MKGKAIFFFTLLNIWIWKVFLFSPIIAILIFCTTITFYLSLKNRKKYLSKFIMLFLFLLIFQVKTTVPSSLTSLTNDQIRQRDQRLREYPPVRINVFGKTLWIPAAHLLEGRIESIAFSRIKENFFETLDPNLYFFANSPRQRIGIDEFEKFPYIYLPFFIYGVFFLFENKDKQILLISVFLPIILLSVLGHNNPIGPFLLFPFLAVATTIGANELSIYVAKNRIFLIILLLILIQVISYEIY